LHLRFIVAVFVFMFIFIFCTGAVAYLGTLVFYPLQAYCRSKFPKPSPSRPSLIGAGVGTIP
jgi:hypothetical protein